MKSCVHTPEFRRSEDLRVDPSPPLPDGRLATPSRLWRLALLCGLLGMGGPMLPAQELPPAQRPATGLRPPTAEEQDWMDKHLKKTRKAKLNRLGLERVNQGRRARGLAPLDLPVAPDGQESVSDE